MMKYDDDKNFTEYYYNGNKHRVLKDGMIKKYYPDGRIMMWTKNGIEIFYDFDGNIV